MSLFSIAGLRDVLDVRLTQGDPLNFTLKYREPDETTVIPFAGDAIAVFAAKKSHKSKVNLFSYSSDADPEIVMDDVNGEVQILVPSVSIVPGRHTYSIRILSASEGNFTWVKGSLIVEPAI